MKLTVTDSDQIIELEVDSEMSIQDFRELVLHELKYPANTRINLALNNTLLHSGPLSLNLITNNDLIVVSTENSTPITSSTSSSPASESESARLHILGNPELKAQFIRQNSLISGVLDDSVAFSRIYAEMKRQMRQNNTLSQNSASRNSAPQNTNKNPGGDLLDSESQKLIEDEINRQRIDRNYEDAIENNPEFFGVVSMLYIDVFVNSFKVKAFVDSGAQATIISKECAQKCNIMHLLDKRFSGLAKGVGTAIIQGKIHSTDIQVGGLSIPVSMTLIEGCGVDLLFGLDVLKRHQAVIDLKKNCLTIYGVDVPFLPEHEQPQQSMSNPVIVDSNPEISSQTSLNETRSKSKKIDITEGSSLHTANEQTTSKHNEKSIKVLTDLGVSYAEAIQLLDACNGNADLAADMLFR